MVAGGFIKIIDLEDSSLKCDTLVPLETSRFGGLTETKRPLLCNQDCWIYEEGVWTLEEIYQPGLREVSASQSPFDGQLWISGGTD